MWGVIGFLVAVTVTLVVILFTRSPRPTRSRPAPEVVRGLLIAVLVLLLSAGLRPPPCDAHAALVSSVPGAAIDRQHTPRAVWC